METNVSTLLREFPKVRRAVLSGEDVIVHTREGDLRITAEKPKGGSLLGCMQGCFGYVSDDIVGPTTTDDEWKPSL
ncbi:hypothetical protein [Coraliomargarita parva]|uniref:hypothetical protein n=1 Tax=Coraliomargarita parva TaxID=3014050 RepID=UPI0022B45587|nr:hypothetical protein [Coraliomargarita parva]